MNCKILTLLFWILFVENLYSQKFEWAQKKVIYAYNSFGTDVVCDSAGNVYYLSLVYPWHHGSKFKQSLLTKLNPEGTALFSKGYSGNPDAIFSHLEKMNDSLFVSIAFNKKFNMNNVNIKTNGGYDVAGLKMDLNGNCMVGKFGGSNYNYEYSSGFISDEFHNMYLTGNYYGKAYFNKDSIQSKGQSDIVIVKYKPNGNLKYLKSIGGSSIDSVSSIALNPNNGITVCGIFYGSMIIDGDTLFSQGMKDVFIAKFNSDGQLMWCKSGGSPTDDRLTKCAVDASGNIYITGNNGNGFLFENNQLNASGTNDNFIIKLAKDGTVLWAKSFGTPNEDHAADICINKSGSVYIGGNFKDTLTCDTLKRISRNNYDLYVLKLDTAGNAQWLIKAGSHDTIHGNKNCFLKAITADDFGNLYLTGTFTRQSSFGVINLHNNGKNQSFIAKINDAATMEVSPNIICEGDSVNFDINSSQTFAPGNYFVFEQTNESGNFDSLSVMDTIYSSANNFSIKVKTNPVNNTGDYRFRLHTSNPIVTGTTLPIKIHADASPISGPVQICTGQQVWLTSVNNFVNSYQWMYNGVAIPGANLKYYLTPKNQSGIYNCIITNFCFNDTSPDFILPYTVSTPVTLIIPFDSIANNCGDTIDLNQYVNFTGGVFSGAYVQDTLYIPPTNAPDQTNILYYYTDSSGCSYYANDVVTSWIDDYIEINGLPTGVICKNHPPFSLTGFPAGGTFTSNCGTCIQGGVFNPNVVPPNNFNVYLTYSVQGIYGCVEQGYLNFTVSPCTPVDETIYLNMNSYFDPNGNKLHIENVTNGKYEIRISESEGKTISVQTHFSTDGKITINLNHTLANGVYIVTQIGNQSIYNQKIFISHN